MLLGSWIIPACLTIFQISNHPRLLHLCNTHIDDLPTGMCRQISSVMHPCFVRQLIRQFHRPPRRVSSVQFLQNDELRWERALDWTYGHRSSRKFTAECSQSYSYSFVAWEPSATGPPSQNSLPHQNLPPQSKVPGTNVSPQLNEPPGKRQFDSQCSEDSLTNSQSKCAKVTYFDNNVYKRTLTKNVQASKENVGLVQKAK